MYSLHSVISPLHSSFRENLVAKIISKQFNQPTFLYIHMPPYFFPTWELFILKHIPEQPYLISYISPFLPSFLVLPPCHLRASQRLRLNFRYPAHLTSETVIEEESGILGGTCSWSCRSNEVIVSPYSVPHRPHKSTWGGAVSLREAGRADVLSTSLSDARDSHQAQPSLLHCPKAHPPSAPTHRSDLESFSKQ